MKIEKSGLEQTKARCPDCRRELGRRETFTQQDFDYMLYLALTHERKHPTHEVEVQVFEGADIHVD
jgi:hypothetical protein